MISDMPVFRVFGAIARYAAETQRVAAENISNADLPGYKAEELEAFSDFMERVDGRLSHEYGFERHQADTPSSPNGNSVDLEYEMVKTAEASGQHALAMTTYTKMLDMLRTAAGVRS